MGISDVRRGGSHCGATPKPHELEVGSLKCLDRVAGAVPCGDPVPWEKELNGIGPCPVVYLYR